MSNPILKSAMLLAFATLSALAVAADDPPARVGRVALTQGRVSIGGEVGAEMTPAQVNWPVTSGTMLTTAAGSRTELRIGSTSIRLDGDSSLEVTELDDDSIRLRLYYGSASVRIVNADVLRGFELLTPQARVRLQQPGRVRIDAERLRDTSAVNVFDGAALVDAGGSQLTVRAGKRLEVTDDDMRTANAQQDAFDSWSFSRDRIEDNAASRRYVTTEMTGYEDLDRYGSWRTDSEYGPLWMPAVAADWVPYRDGSWTWIEPWGWTWVDNAPWGYAPFHYGRWVYVNRRWAWAPGSRVEHAVWAPALVGWVGGSGWDFTFRDRSRRPGFGWYPLSPHDRYVPSYHASENHLRWLNDHVRTTPQRGRDYRPQGLTVVPQDRFGAGGRVNVRKAPIATVPPALVHNGQNMNIPATSAPPAPPNRPHRGNVADRDHDREHDRGAGRPDRFEAQRVDRNGDREHDRNGGPGRPDRIETARAERDGFVRQGPRPQPVIVQQQQAPGTVPMAAPVRPQGVVSPTPHQPTQAQPVVSPTPHMPSTPQPLTSSAPVFHDPSLLPGAPPPRQERQERRDWDAERRDGREHRDGRNGHEGIDPRRERRDEGERQERQERRPAPVSMAAPPAPVQHAAVMTAPQPAPQRVAPPPPPPPPAAAPAAVASAPPVARPAPPPPQASAPAHPAPARAEERKRGDEHARQQER
ncbi:DUF6600 domain-containing protein [Massilia sp. WF1]|uniref:DUF6600 domain-containing protein n=1 Tax=Massilia sp. WF1 TaxID=1406431 RepID=UPI00068AB26A|nr:DUF6600 domain-containing protein [Massilia sp. WF1]